MIIEGRIDADFNVTPPTSPRKRRAEPPRIYTSTPVSRKSPALRPQHYDSIICIDDDNVLSPTKKSFGTPIGTKINGSRRVAKTPDAALLFEKEEKRRQRRDTDDNWTMTYRVEKMTGQVMRSGDMASSPATRSRRPVVPENAAVRRSPRLQKAREAEVSNAKLCLLDENNNNGKAHAETNQPPLNHSSSRSASKLVLDTSAEVRNWCRTHSTIDKAAPFVVFILFMALMYYLATLLHAAHVPSNLLKLTRNGWSSLADYINHLRQ